ncbi:MAG: hypothetical protein AAF741_02450 [Bacteroidota bacterium]
MPQPHPIRFLKRYQIDDSAWDERVAQDPSMPIYTMSWYLDAATKAQWHAIVYGDYEYLLPLPLNFRFFGLPRVVTPPLCQQLGVLTSSDLPLGGQEEADAKGRIRAMLSAIPSRYLDTNLKLRLPWIIKGEKSLSRRLNLIIDLSKYDYDRIHTGYNKSLKKRLRRASRQYLIEPCEDITALIEMYRKEVGLKAGLKPWMYNRISEIISACIERKEGQIWKIITPNAEVHARGFFAGKSRVINLFGSSNAAGRAGFAMHFLLDRVIAKSAEGGANIFDFEGSQIPGVRQFFESYGPDEEFYFDYRSSLLKN